MNADKDRLNKLSEKVIGCAFEVHNVLGCGFLEKVYENALVVKLRKERVDFIQQAPVKVYFEDEIMEII